MMTVAEYFAAELWSAGVETVYGLPGGENVELLEALRQRGIDFMLVKNESSACFMAATSARLTGKIGVALSTLGPGAANAYAGLAHAWLDRAAVLLITAVTDPELIGKHSHQVLDLEAIFRPITKFTVELSASNASGAIATALELARADRPGPVHLSLHNRIALQQITVETASVRVGAECRTSSADLEAIKTLLVDKEKPIILVGLGLEPEGAYEQIRRLAESLNAPVIDTPKSKGALPADHPLFAGTIGLTREDPVYQLLDEADGIIAIGFDVVELVKPWDYLTPLIWIANWENHDPRIHSDLEYVGSVAAILDALGEVPGHRADDWGAKRVRRFRETQAEVVLPAAKADHILPQSFLASLRANTAQDIIVTTDVGSHKIFTALNWAAQLPNRYFVSNGLSAMGFGLSSAIAAADVTGEHTVCITGDAGLAMVSGELGLLAEKQLPVLVMVMNDAALDLIRSAQGRRNRPTFGTEFRNPDFEYLAKAYGLAYRKVQSRQECDQAIRAGMAARAPMLIDVMIDPISYPTSVRS